MNLSDLYQQAIRHQQEHNCSAHPYENYQKLFDYVTANRPNKILEIGTGIGFTSVVMALASDSAQIETLEKDSEHAQMAQDFITKQGLSDRIIIHNVIAEDFLVTLTGPYDLIFFDGFQIHYEFLPHYERLLHSGGILILGNNHLTSKTSDQFFTELAYKEKWQIVEQFSETTIAIKL